MAAMEGGWEAAARAPLRDGARSADSTPNIRRIPINNQGSPFNNHCKAVFFTVSTPKTCIRFRYT